MSFVLDWVHKGPFFKKVLLKCMSEVKSGHDIESETGHSIDHGSFFYELATAGNEIENGVKMCSNDNPISPSIT